MIEQSEATFIRLPEWVKDLLRFRAARQRRTMSDVARDMILDNVRSLSQEERLFLASQSHEVEHIIQNSEQPSHA